MTDVNRSPVLVIGAGGHGRVVSDIFLSAGRRVLGFLDDDPAAVPKALPGVPVLGTIADAPAIAAEEDAEVIVGIGNNAIRGRLLRALEAQGLRLATAVHPAAIVAEDVVVGPGVAVMAGVTLSTGTHVGYGAVVNTKACIGAECVLGDLVQILPASVLTMGVTVEPFAYVGSRATILPGLRVGSNAWVGAGALVREDVPPDAVVVGVPGRVVKTRRRLDARA